MEHAFLLRVFFICCVLQATVWGQETLCNISYTNMPFPFNSNTADLICNIPKPMWWFSNDPCGPFIPSTLCSNGTSLCENFNVTRIEDHFYHCCTRGDTVANSEMNRDCIHVQICTSITSHSAPPIAVYGRTLLLYVEVYSHPQPQEEHTVFYHSTRISNTQVSVYQKSPLSPLLTFEYAIPVPLVDLVTIQETDPEDRRVLLTTSFTRSCAEDRNSIDLSIPLLSGEEDTTPPFSTRSGDPTTEGVSGQGQCTDHDLWAGLVVVLVILAVMGVVSIAAIVYLIYSKRRLKVNLTLARSDSADPNSRPSSLNVVQYSRLAQDHTPSPACPPGAQPNSSHPNGTLPSQQSSMNTTMPTRHDTPSTTPLRAPSNLALGVTHSHTGHTPLISFTPGGPGQPFPVPDTSVTQVANAAHSSPPLYDEVVANGTIVEEVVPVSPYATTVVGGASGSGVPAHGTRGGDASAEPIYNNTTIDELASGIELSVHPATDV